MKLDFIYLSFLLLIAQRTYGRKTSDYFQGRYDPDRNCVEEDLMKNLTKESFPRCASVFDGRDIVEKSKLI